MAPSGPSKRYVAEGSTEVELRAVRDLRWPPDLPKIALPTECLRRKQPLTRTCRYPGTAVQRLSAVWLDAYQASHLDPEQPIVCESRKLYGKATRRVTRAEKKALPSPTLDDRQRALDRDLADLEGCTEFPPGFVRALRAHEEPRCADALAQIPLEAGEQRVHPASDRAASTSSRNSGESQGIDDVWRDLLYGQALAAVFERWFRRPVQALDSADPIQFEGWIKRVLQPYLDNGRAQLETARRVVERLPDGSNGRRVAEDALLNAEYRMVRIARAVQIPDNVKRDYQLRTLFYGAFDSATQSIVEVQNRNRLSSCRLRAEQGWLDDAPFVGKKSSDMLGHGELRCSPFTQLPLPFPLAPRQDVRQSSDPMLRLSATLPPAFVDALLSDERRVDPEIHRALLTRGAPRSVRQSASLALASGHVSPKQSEELHLALARSEFRLGLAYFAPKSWERAQIELAFAPDTSEVRLLRALTTTLLFARPDVCPEWWQGPCFVHDTSALREFLKHAASEPRDIVAIAEAALARLALDHMDDDFTRNVHTMLERATDGGAYYISPCWYEQWPEAHPFLYECRGYPCLNIPWQGR